MQSCGNFRENGSFLGQLQPGILEITVRGPATPPLNEVFVGEVGEQAESAGNARSEAVAGDLVDAVFAEVR